MPFSARALLKRKNIFSLTEHDILAKKKQIECGLALSVLLSTTIRVITVVKICCGLTRRSRVLVVGRSTDSA